MPDGVSDEHEPDDQRADQCTESAGEHPATTGCAGALGARFPCRSGQPPAGPTSWVVEGRARVAVLRGRAAEAGAGSAGAAGPADGRSRAPQG